MTYEYQPFPEMIYRGNEQRIVADAEERRAALADGWRTADQLRALDGDEDSKPGGSKPRKARQEPDQ